MTKSVRSTEFLLTVLANLVGIALVVGSFFAGPKVAMVMQALGVAKMVLANLGYTYGRSMVKAAEAKAKGGIEVFNGDASA